MLRISKLTDYGIVLLANFAQEGSGATRNAREMSEATDLPFPVVSKMLKTLAAARLLESQRGAHGGYSLIRQPDQVTVAEIIEALEGPIALMECTAGPGYCEKEPHCQVREPWVRINQAIQQTLERVTLDELVSSGSTGDRPLLEIQNLPISDAAAEPPSR